MPKTVKINDAVDADLARLTMLELSASGRRIMLYAADGEHLSLEDADTPFDAVQLLRRLQVAASGYSLCPSEENSVIFTQAQVKYIVVEPAKSANETIITVGVNGRDVPHLMQTSTEAAEGLIAGVGRQYVPLRCMLQDGREMLFDAAAVVYAQHKNDKGTIALDFGAAGAMTITPAVQEKGYFKTPENQLRDAFSAVSTRAATGVMAGLARAIDRLHAINHVSGTLLIDPAQVLRTEPQDYPDDPPSLRIVLPHKDDEKYIVLGFATVEERDAALALLTSEMDGWDGSDPNQPRYQAAKKAKSREGDLPPGVIIPGLDNPAGETPQPPTMPGRGQIRHLR